MPTIPSFATPKGIVQLPGRTPLLDRKIEIPNTEEGIEELRARLVKEGVPGSQAEGPDTRSIWARLSAFFETLLYGSNVKEVLMLACIAFHPDTPSHQAMDAYKKLEQLVPEASQLTQVKEVEVKGDNATLRLSSVGLAGENPLGGGTDELIKVVPSDRHGKRMQSLLLKQYEKALNNVPNAVPELNEEKLAQLGPNLQAIARNRHARASAEHGLAVTRYLMDSWTDSVKFSQNAGEYQISLEGGGDASPFRSPEAAAAAQTNGSIKVAHPKEVCLHIEDLLALDVPAREARGVNLKRAQADRALLLLQLDTMTEMSANDYTWVQHPESEWTPVQRVVTQDGTNLVVTIKCSNILPANLVGTERALIRQVDFTQRWTIGPEKGDVHCTTSVDPVSANSIRGIKRQVI